MNSSATRLCSLKTSTSRDLMRSEVSGSSSSVSHRRLRALLRFVDAVELGLVLDPPALRKVLVVRRQRDAFGAETVGEQEREVGRDDRLLHSELRDGVLERLQQYLAPRQALRKQLVIAELLEGVGGDAGRLEA